jgi:hypothetical protein
MLNFCLNALLDICAGSRLPRPSPEILNSKATNAAFTVTRYSMENEHILRSSKYCEFGSRKNVFHKDYEEWRLLGCYAVWLL